MDISGYPSKKPPLFPNGCETRVLGEDAYYIGQIPQNFGGACGEQKMFAKPKEVKL